MKDPLLVVTLMSWGVLLGVGQIRWTLARVRKGDSKLKHLLYALLVPISVVVLNQFVIGKALASGYAGETFRGWAVLITLENIGFATMAIAAGGLLIAMAPRSGLMTEMSKV